MFRSCCACLIVVLATPLLVSAQSPATAEATLRTAGIEPTTDGLKEYLQSLLKDEAPRKIAQLIADLGHDSFDKRERATKALAETVSPPVAALTVASRSDDAEVAWRAQKLLKAAKPQADPTLAAAISLIASKKLDVGLPLLIELHQRTEQPVRASVMVAILALLAESDRATIDALAKRPERVHQDLARVLLARLDRKELPADLTKNYDATQLKSGGVAGGGPDLIDGWEFQAKTDLVVTDLGIFDRQPLGLIRAHEVAIWDLENREKPVVQITIPAGEEAKLIGEFRVVPVERTKLAAGRKYAVVAHYPDTSDPNVGLINPSGLTIEYAPHIEVLGRRYAFPHKAMAYPSTLGAGADHATHGPTFRFEAVELGK